jgi:hypothetical protein
MRGKILLTAKLYLPLTYSPIVHAQVSGLIFKLGRASESVTHDQGKNERTSQIASIVAGI